MDHITTPHPPKKNNYGKYEDMIYQYLLLTEFEGHTVSYRPSFFLINLWPKREAVYSMDPENEVSKIFIISLLCVYSRGTASNL